MLATGSIVLAAGLNNAVAQDDDDDHGAVPVEIYTCSYAEGMGPADLDAVIAKWNTWADEREMNDYSAWTLTPFFAGPEQEFDVIWMGVTETGQAMGAAQDDWIANGGNKFKIVFFPATAVVGEERPMPGRRSLCRSIFGPGGVCGCDIICKTLTVRNTAVSK